MTARGQSGWRTLVGYAVPFHVLTTEPIRLERGGPALREVMTPETFTRSLGRGHEIIANVNHWGAAVATTRDGSLRVRQDGRGIAFELDLPDSVTGEDVLVHEARGSLRGASVVFSPRDHDTTRGADGQLVRVVLDAELHEIALIVAPHEPAYPHAVARSLGRDPDRARQLRVLGRALQASPLAGRTPTERLLRLRALEREVRMPAG